MMMGGGTGFAPLNSVIKNLAAQDDRRRETSIRGTRS